MKKKILFLLILTGVILIGSAFYIFSKVLSKNPISAIQIKPIATPTPYPKPESYQVPILMYHYVRNAENESEMGKNLSVSPENFEKQIKYFRDNGYESLKLADLADPDKKILSKIIFEKKKPIVLTFDDGYADAYTDAWPILKKYEMAGTFFIIRNYVGKDNYMNQTQIDELEKAGMEIGSHTLTHPDLTKINFEDAVTQISDSKLNALTFCYPAGRYDQTTVKLVQEAGYHAAVTTHFGIANQNSSILELPRVRVENTSAEVLMDKINAALGND